MFTSKAFIRSSYADVTSVFEDGQWHILEPVMTVEINGPEEYRNDVLENITERHAIIQATDSNEGFFTIFCEVSQGISSNLVLYLNVFIVLLEKAGKWLSSRQVLD